MKYAKIYAVITCLIAVPAVGTAATPTTIASSSATIDGLSYRLVDLDPNDGVTPWINFTQQDGSPMAVVLSTTQVEQVRPSGFDERNLQLDGNLFSDTSGQLSSRDGLATAGKQGNSLSATARTNHDADEFSGLAMQGLTASSGWASNWILSPKTALVLEGSLKLVATMNADPFIGPGVPHLTEELFLSADAAAYLDLVLDNRDGLVGPDPNFSVQDMLHLRSDAVFYGPARGKPTIFPNDSKEQAFSLSVSNIGNSERLGSMSISTTASNGLFTTPAASVPEPSAAALTLLGLLGVITVAKRRRG